MVEKILSFLRVDCLEVPFILRHRRDYFAHRLNDVDIWDISDRDERWNHIIAQKTAVKVWHTEFPELEQMIMDAADEIDVKDMADYIQLHSKLKQVPPAGEEDEPEVENGARRKYKRPVRKDIFILAKEANLSEFAKVIF
jgi:transcriptional accessory protein Tex/SPT6